MGSQSDSHCDSCDYHMAITVGLCGHLATLHLCSYHSQTTVPLNKQRGGSLIRACGGWQQRCRNRLSRLEDRMAGAVRLPTEDGGLNRRQNLRFLIPHHGPLYNLQGKCTDYFKGRSWDQLQVGITERGTRGGNASLKREQEEGVHC